MTFISTVKARNGAAIIADSLVTNTHYVIVLEEFLKYVAEKEKLGEPEIKIIPDEIYSLFNNRPSHTKNFEEKLFKYDNYTCVTTAGSARINDKRIEDIIHEIVKRNSKSKGYSNKKFETKVNDFISFITDEVKEHLRTHTTIRPTTFVLTHYNRHENKTHVHKINVLSASQKDLENPDFQVVQHIITEEYEKVVCEGQNRISEKILYGDFFIVHALTSKIFNRFVKDFKIEPDQIPDEYIDKLKLDKEFTALMFSDMKMFKLSELSLQQAVDLANLLMHIEMDFQNYTENIPTVGGVIKIAVIDGDGFRFLSGKEIRKPSQL